MTTVPFMGIEPQRDRLGARLDAALRRVLDHGGFIMGPEVAELEQKLAVFAGCRHCVSCASGTDALELVVRAWGLGPGDAVFVPAFTFVAPAEVVALVGATPVFVDVGRDHFTLDPDALERAVVWAAGSGLRPRAVIPVDLFGQPADYRRILPVAGRHGLSVLADAAQSFGAALDGRRVGGLARATATSFFPAKPLGCYGDGGAVFTDEDDLAALLRSLRVHGQGTDKYDNVRLGRNSRLDTLQAAVLLEKLAIYPEEIAARDGVAGRYRAALADLVPDFVQVPALLPGASSVWAQFTIVTPHRDTVAAACRAAGVPTAVYYPRALPGQTGYRGYPTGPGGVPNAVALAGQVISLPMHAYLSEADQDRVIAALRGALS